MQKERQYILLADDDPEDQDAFIEAFARLHPNVSVITMNDGQRLLEFLDTCDRNTLPVLFLIDFKMQVVHAPEVLQRLAGNNTYSAIPKLVWSTSIRTKDMEECKRFGASGYFKKPASYKEVDDLVQQISEIFTGRLTHLKTLQVL